ncbi:alginate lyase family protein [Nostoc ellipsosporum NOK]|nr:alginate lyase family protein [Nostoc ellipsosporum NOK]
MIPARLKWYYYRLQTMQPAEWAFRGKQWLQKQKEKRQQVTPVFDHVTCIYTDFPYPFDGMQVGGPYTVFGKELDPATIRDFHLDIFSGKRFPPHDFSKDIDIRTDRHGSAKVVWEVNRLHYLLPLLLRYRKEKDRAHLDLFMRLMRDWQEQNTYLRGINWYSNIEVCLRLINWHWCWNVLSSDEHWTNSEECNAFRTQTWIPLVYQHCHYAARNPSLYSSANNHLVAEYAGLWMATLTWKFPESDKWNEYAKEGLEREILLQYSPSGIHREEASVYIQFATDFFLQSLIAGQQHNADFSAAYHDRLKAAIGYIDQLMDIRYQVPHYGDEDDGRVILPDNDHRSNNFVSLLNTAARIWRNADWDITDEPDTKTLLLTAHLDRVELIKGEKEYRSVCYQEDGHAILRKTDIAQQQEIYCHFDAAPLGYLSIAAHGHADALSVVLHVDGYPFLTDPGTFAYHTHPEHRKYFTSTLAHNTITIDHTDQAILAGPTLWLQHYKAQIDECIIEETGDTVTGSHNGYRQKQIKHSRTVYFDKQQEQLTLSDSIKSEKANYHVAMPFHLHPDIQVRQTAANCYRLSHPATKRVVDIEMDRLLEVHRLQADEHGPQGWYSPSFMQKQPSSYLLGECVSEKKSLVLTTTLTIITPHEH